MNHPGTVLRAARLKSGLSLRALAGSLDCSHTYLCDIEKQRRLPSYAFIGKLAKLKAKDAAKLADELQLVTELYLVWRWRCGRLHA